MKQAYIPARDVTETNPWQKISPGGEVREGGTAALFPTGDWRTMIPGYLAEKCRHCLLCFPVCPDSAVLVRGGKRLDFDFAHCKGCGVCYKVCPFGAITFEKEEK